MSISNIQILHDLAETSLVSYANPNSTAKNTENDFADELVNEVRGSDLTPVQAKQFTDKYQFIDQQKNIDFNGFSAMVLLDKQTLRKVFAVRGTEFTQGVGQILTDGAQADALGIGASAKEIKGLPFPIFNSILCRP